MSCVSFALDLLLLLACRASLTALFPDVFSRSECNQDAILRMAGCHTLALAYAGSNDNAATRR
jgi:hypothetical protein